MNVYHKIYAIFNKKDNSICYVGITKNSLKARLSNHKKSKSSSAYAYMHFYGIDNFDIKLLEIVKNDRILGYQREIYWTKYYSQFYQLQNRVLGNSLKFNDKLPHVKSIEKDNEIVLLNNEHHYLLSEAIKKFYVNHQTIIDVCLGKKKNEHGRVWTFLKDYQTMTPQDIKNKIITSHSRITSKSIVCVTNGRLFTCIEDASKIMKIKENDIIFSIQNSEPCCYINKVPILFKKFNKFSYMEEMWKIFSIKQNNKPIFIGMTRKTFNESGIINRLNNFNIKINDCEIEFLNFCYDYEIAKEKVNQFIKIYSKKYQLISKLPIDDRIKKLINKERTSLNPKHILCITTNEVFLSAEHAAKHYKLQANNILKCCFNRSHFCGTLNNGKQLKWKFTNQKIDVQNNQFQIKKNTKKYNYVLYQVAENNLPIYFGITNNKIKLPKEVEKYAKIFNCTIKELQYFDSKQKALNAQIQIINDCKNSLFNNEGRKILNKKIKINSINYIVGIKNDKFVFIFTCKDNIEKHFHTHLTNLKKKHYFINNDFTYQILCECKENPYKKKQEFINLYKPLFNIIISNEIEHQAREQLKLDKNKHVKCIELNLVFENLKCAAKAFKCKQFHIGKHLYKLKEYAFTLKNGTHLHWMYTDETPNADSFDTSLLIKRSS